MAKDVTQTPPEDLKRALKFYEMSPTGQYDEEACAALEYAIAQQWQAVAQPADPFAWVAVLDEEQRPHQLNTGLHAVVYLNKALAEEFVASKKTFDGWRYQLCSLYLGAQQGQPVAELVALELERLAKDAPISGNTIAQARVLMAAASVREFGLGAGSVPQLVAQPAQSAALALLKRIRYHALRHSLPREWLTAADEVLGTWHPAKFDHPEIAAGAIDAEVAHPQSVAQPVQVERQPLTEQRVREIVRDELAKRAGGTA